jgi:electron transfer flavoprotein alpha subunit
MKTVVFIEKNPVTNKLRDVSLELSAKAYSLMQPYNGEVVGVFVGDQLPEDSDLLFQYGLNRLVYTLKDELKHLHSIAYKNAIEAMIKKEAPQFVLFGATHTGRDIAPLISSSLVTGLTADCTQLYIDDYKDNGKILYQMRPAFGGNILATIITPNHTPTMATVREGVMRLPEKKVNHQVITESFDFDFDTLWIKNQFLKVVPKKRKVNFKSSNIIVAGGAGVGSKENFKLLYHLADALGGEVGASRAAVDYGYCDKARQIGQTGAVVRPKLYIACGISGSIQHRAGMAEANKIIAINSDPEAPIFGIAHLGIVEDLRTVIPMMVKYLKEES